MRIPVERLLAACLVLAPLLPASVAGAQSDDEEQGEKLPQYHRIFYVQPHVGYGWSDAGAIQQDGELLAVQGERDGGLNVGGALGFKLLFFDLGARATYTFAGGYDLGALMGELGVRIPLPIFEPIVRVGFGYGWLDPNDGALSNLLDESVDGPMLDVGIGLDVWVWDHLTIGIDGAVGFYFLSRAAVDCSLDPDQCRDLDPDEAMALSEDGAAAAVQVRLALTVGFWL